MQAALEVAYLLMQCLYTAGLGIGPQWQICLADGALVTGARMGPTEMISRHPMRDLTFLYMPMLKSMVANCTACSPARNCAFISACMLRRHSTHQYLKACSCSLQTQLGLHATPAQAAVKAPFRACVISPAANMTAALSEAVIF